MTEGQVCQCDRDKYDRGTVSVTEGLCKCDRGTVSKGL